MFRWFVPALTILIFCSAAAGAEERPVTVFVYHGDHAAPKPGEPVSPRNQYTMDVLREALERTREAYGDFELTPTATASRRA